MVFYTSMDAGDARSLTEAFQRKYPFIKTDLFRGGREAVFSRFSLERKAGRYVTDVVSVGEFHVLEMKKQGLLTQYRIPRSASVSEGLQRSAGILDLCLPDRLCARL